MKLLHNKIRFDQISCLRPFWLWVTLSIIIGLTLTAVIGVSSIAAAQVEPSGSYSAEFLLQGANEGKAIFDEKCAGCHTIGGGNRIGPDLKDVANRRDLQWIKDFISDPAKMIASDPIAQQLLKDYNNITMPNLGLSPTQVDGLVEYLKNPGSAAAAPTASGPMPAGDPIVGIKLFSGELGLANGGPSCISCHTVSGTGLFGGGALGPDLTHVITRLGEPSLSAALKTIAFPTMLGPFQNRPLSPKEQSDLVAFLRDADQTQPPVPVFAPGAITWRAILLLGIGLVGAGLLFGLLLFFWFSYKKRSLPNLPVRKL